MISKPLDAIALDDLQRLRENRISEGKEASSTSRSFRAEAMGRKSNSFGPLAHLLTWPGETSFILSGGSGWHSRGVPRLLLASA